MVSRDVLYIGGEWQRSSSSEELVIINPTTEEPMGRAPVAGYADVDRAVAAARQAFDEGEWPRLAPEDRIARFQAAMDLMGARIDEIGALVTDEMGAPAWMRGHFNWAQDFWRDIRSSYEAHVLEELRRHEQGKTLVVREPVGVVAAISPWNGPLLLSIEKAASALVTGCTCVLKPSEQTPLDAYFLTEALHDAGVPAGVFNLVTGGRDVGEYLVSHAGVDKVSLTGSTTAGSRVGEICGRTFKRASLELGGKSAAVILEDADLDKVASALRWGNFISTGQACNLLSRVVVPRKRHDEIVEALVANARGLRIGEPRELSTEIGPLAMQRQYERVANLVAQASAEGARLVTGGARPAHMARGWFFEPTVFDNVKPEMTIAREEVFGPVVSVLAYDDENQAIAIANDSDYGLGGAVFSEDRDRAIAVARQMRAGAISINRYGTAPNAPFGGYKASGIGREHGPEGIEEHLIVKSIGFEAN